jgi:hypothetical protein
MNFDKKLVSGKISALGTIVTKWEQHARLKQQILDVVAKSFTDEQVNECITNQLELVFNAAKNGFFSVATLVEVRYPEEFKALMGTIGEFKNEVEEETSSDSCEKEPIQAA